MTTVLDIAQLAGIEVNTLLTRIKGEFGDEIPQVYEWSPQTSLGDGEADEIINWLGLDEHRGNLNRIDEKAITKADEAVKAAANKLTQTIKANLQQIADLQKGQAEIIGEASGVSAALAFQRAHIRGNRAVMNAFISETSAAVQAVLAAIDSEVIGLAQEAGEWLGESVRQRQQTSELLTRLRARVRSLTEGL